MPPVVSIAEFLVLLGDSQLLDEGKLSTARQDLATKLPDAPSLAEALVERHWLTRYQAEQLLARKSFDLVLGPYRLLELIGEGGMGQVFKALHQRLNRVVALKVIRPERLSKDPELVRRFRREAQAAAQLSHPNIVIVYDADQIDNTHFIAMEYVDGVDLSKVVRESGPLPVTQACDYVRQAALGLQHAFEHDLVHRDVKPSNLLLSFPRASRFAPPAPEGRDITSVANISEIRSGGIIKILDMGLVRLVQPPGSEKDTSFQTQLGTVMGTPDYIAPEQARNPSGVDIRADLYSLGCTLYFLLTGRAPFEEGSMVEKLLMHQMDEPKPVEQLRPGLPEPVVRVVKKLMSKRPDDRYQTPLEAAEALAQATAVPPPPAPPAPAAVPASPASPVTLARPELPSTAVFQVTPVTVTPPPPEEKPSRPSEAHKQISLCKGHQGWVMALAFTPDRNQLVSGGVDGTVRLWGFSSQVPREQTLTQVNRGEVHAVAVAPDGLIFASGSGTLDGLICLWTLAKGQGALRTVLPGHKAPVAGLAFSADSRLLASTACDRTVRVWDLVGSEPKERSNLKAPAEVAQGVAVSPDGKAVALGCQDGSVCLWHWGKWTSDVTVLRGHTGPVRSVAFSGDGKTLASGSVDQTVRLWDLADPSAGAATVLTGHSDGVRFVLFPTGDATLFSAGDRGHAILWDVVGRMRQREWPALKTLFNSVASTYDGRYLAVGKSDGNVAVFRLYPRR